MNFKEALLTVDLILESKAVPLLVGESGIGKTALAKALCEKNNYHLITIDGNLLKEGEIGGLPITEDYTVNSNGKLINRKRTVYAVHHKLQEIDKVLMEDSSKTILLFIDEINRCEHVVQQELMNIILNREINGFGIPPQTLIMAAMNPSGKANSFSFSEYQVVEMDPAQENRIVWVEVESDVGNWLEWGKTSCEVAGDEQYIHNDVLDFIAAFPQYLHKPESQDSIKATPRSWERVSNTYKIIINHRDKYEKDIFYNVIKGNVGSLIAQEFVNFITDKSKNYVTAAEILKLDDLTNEISAKIQAESYERQYLLAINCIGEISRVKNNKRMIKVFCKMLQLYPNDLKLAIMKKIKRDYSDNIFNSFLDEEDFIEAYFQIYVKDRA